LCPFHFKEVCRNGVVLSQEKIFQVKHIHTGISGIPAEKIVYTMEIGLDMDGPGEVYGEDELTKFSCVVFS